MMWISSFESLNSHKCQAQNPTARMMKDVKSEFGNDKLAFYVQMCQLTSVNSLMNIER